MKFTGLQTCLRLAALNTWNSFAKAVLTEPAHLIKTGSPV